MVDDTTYVQSVRHVVGMTTERWERQEATAGYNKQWEIYYEAAEEIANVAFEVGADPNQVPTLVRDNFFTLARDARSDMAIRKVDCVSARKSVATRARRQAMQTKDVVKLEACFAAASLLESAGDVWVTTPSARLSPVNIGGETLWNEVVGNAQAAARTAFDNRAQPRKVSDLFGGFFNHFMVVVRTRRKVEGLSWGATKKSVAGAMLRGYIPTDPVRAAAYTAAALMLEAVPSGDIAESPISPPACSEPRRAVAPAAAAAAAASTASAEFAPRKGPNAPSARVNTLSSLPTATTPISGTRDTVASMTKGCGPNLLADTTSSDHAATSSPPPGGRKSNNNNNNTTTVCTTTMPPPTGINRTRWANQRYSPSGSANDPTRTESTSAVGVGERANRLPATASPNTPTVGQPVGATVGAGVKAQPTPSSGFPPSMDTVGAGSSSSGPYDVSEGASLAPEAAPAMAMQAVGASSGATTRPGPFSADQGAGFVGSSTSGQRTSEDLPETDAGDDVDWYNVMDTLVPTAPEASTGEKLDVDTRIYTPSLDALGPGNSELLGMAPNVPVASEEAAAAVVAAAGGTPSPVVAGAGVGGAGATTAALPGTALGSSVLVAAAAEAAARARAPTAAGAASGPVVEGRNTVRGKKRKSTGGEGGSENPPCDGGARKKARSE